MNCVVVLGCYVIGYIVLVCLLIEKGILFEDYLFFCYFLIGYLGGGKGMIVEYVDVKCVEKYDVLRVYGLSLKYKYLFEM